jgi:pimeloyl-ACP methyl ester carboxylesterase
MSDTPPAPLPAPLLAPFLGCAPDHPAWFAAALAQAPQRRRHAVQGTPIETLSWGEPGRPGLLLLHGKMAHADWWSFIAPFFAATHHVVALSFSGMGGSGWREAYSIETLADEAMAVARAEGLLGGAHKPVFVAHSFGGFASLRCAEQHGTQLGGVVTVDMPLMSPQQRIERNATRGSAIRGRFAQRPTRVYATLAEALARFRFAPPQGCEQLYIADHIARTSLKQVTLRQATNGDTTGWTWRFDPRVAEIHPGDPERSLRAATCPVAVMWGGESALVDAPVAAYMAGLTPPGTPHIEIPAARHHVMVDQPLAFVAALRGLLSAWPAR